MEQTMELKQKYSKETGYNENKHDYIAEGEITITITLAEYRELVKNLATKEAEVLGLKEKIQAFVNGG